MTYPQRPISKVPSAVFADASNVFRGHRAKPLPAARPSVCERLLGTGTRKRCTRLAFRVKSGVVKLVDLLQRSEGKTLEFKRDLSSPDGPLKTLVASANTAGGTLLIGRRG